MVLAKDQTTSFAFKYVGVSVGEHVVVGMTVDVKYVVNAEGGSIVG